MTLEMFEYRLDKKYLKCNFLINKLATYFCILKENTYMVFDHVAAEVVHC